MSARAGPARRRAPDDRPRRQGPRGAGRLPRRPAARTGPPHALLDRPQPADGARPLAGHPRDRWIRRRGDRAAARLGRMCEIERSLRRRREVPPALRRGDARPRDAGRQHLEAGKERERAGSVERRWRRSSPKTCASPGRRAAAEPPPPLARLPEELAAFGRRRQARREQSGRPTYAVDARDARRARRPARPRGSGPAAACPGDASCTGCSRPLMRDPALDVARVRGEPPRRGRAARRRPRRGGADRRGRARFRPLEARARPRRGAWSKCPSRSWSAARSSAWPTGRPKRSCRARSTSSSRRRAAWTLVDYKSDTVGDKLDELVAFYTPQIAIYRRYWERLTGSPTRAGLFFAETGQEVWPALPADARFQRRCIQSSRRP